MQTIAYEEVDGQAIFSTDTAEEWIRSDSVVIPADWR